MVSEVGVLFWCQYDITKEIDVSRFVVPKPFWMYILGLLAVIGIGSYALAIGLILGLIFLLTVAPKPTLTILSIVILIKYWKIALPVIVVLLVIGYFIKSSDTPNEKHPQLSKLHDQ